MDPATEIFEKYRSKLFHLAYGMTGRVALSEDIVQEAYIRWKKSDLDSVRSHWSYLSTIVSNLCLDELKSAKNKRRTYVGPDLPEPIMKSDKTPTDHAAEVSDMLSMAMMVLLKKLTPVQRAVFLLREVFDYDYASIARIIKKSESHSRKIAQRAREIVRDREPRFEPDKNEQEQLLKSMMQAIQQGEIQQLEQLLAEEAILYSDGGGKVTAARKPILGAGNIASFMLGLTKQAPGNMRVEFNTVNGRPGVIVYYGDRLQSVWSFYIDGGKVKEMYVVLNPEKLQHVSNM